MHCRALCLRYSDALRLNSQIGLRYSFEQVPWVPVKNDRFLHTRAAGSEKNGPAVGSLESQNPWADERRNIAKTRLEDSKDIYIDDLSATLEAHRSRNRASTIRKIDTVFEERILPFRRPAFLPLGIESSANEADSTTISETSNSGDFSQRDGSQQILENKADKDDSAGADGADDVHGQSSLGQVWMDPLKPWQHWPADSFQYKEFLGIKPSDKVSEPSLLEYIPMSVRPCYSWQLKGKVQPHYSQWPWLAHVEGYEGDGPERLVRSIIASVSISNHGT